MIFLVLAAVAAAILGISLWCYRIGFYAPPRKPKTDDTIEIPEGEIYEVFREDMENWVRQIRAMPREEVEITSHDGL